MLMKPKRFNLALTIIIVMLLTSFALYMTSRSNTGNDEIKVSVIVEPSLEYITVGKFSEGMAEVRIDNPKPKYGFIDMSGEFVIPCEYSYVFRFSEGLAAVFKDGMYGFIDKNGDTVLPFEYDYAICFANGLAAVRKDGKFGYINKAGETVIPFEFDSAVNFFYSLTTVKKDGKFGIIDLDGNFVVPPEYDNIYIDYDCGIFEMTADGKHGLADLSGNLIVPCIYDRINTSSIADGVITVYLDNKWGILRVENYTPAPDIEPIREDRMIEFKW